MAESSKIAELVADLQRKESDAARLTQEHDDAHHEFQTAFAALAAANEELRKAKDSLRQALAL